MYGDTERGGATTALRYVTCDLSSLTDCVCMSSTASSISGSSSKRKYPSKPSPLIDPEAITPLTAKRLILGRPSLIDRLLYQSKSALQEMEGKKRGPKPKRTPTPVKTKGEDKELNKRKRTSSINGTPPAIKRLRNSKGGSDSESSESRPASIERRKVGRPRLIDKDHNNIKKQSPKKLQRKNEKSRFSKRIVFSSSSLRSGKKRKEFMKRKRNSRHLLKDSKEKRIIDKTDSNSNVCTDSNEDAVDDSSDSEMSREQFEVPETSKNNLSSKSHEDTKRRRKRRKRDSMWVKKVKRVIKAKTENTELTVLSSNSKTDVPDDKDDEEDEFLDALEESDIPILNKESDNSANAEDMNETLDPDSDVPDDTDMPKLEKQVEIDLPIGDENESSIINKTVDTEQNSNISIQQEEPSPEDKSKDEEHDKSSHVDHTNDISGQNNFHSSHISLEQNDETLDEGSHTSGDTETLIEKITELVGDKTSSPNSAETDHVEEFPNPVCEIKGSDSEFDNNDDMNNISERIENMPEDSSKSYSIIAKLELLKTSNAPFTDNVVSSMSTPQEEQLYTHFETENNLKETISFDVKIENSSKENENIAVYDENVKGKTDNVTREKENCTDIKENSLNKMKNVMTDPAPINCQLDLPIVCKSEIKSCMDFNDKFEQFNENKQIDLLENKTNHNTSHQIEQSLECSLSVEGRTNIEQRVKEEIFEDEENLLEATSELDDEEEQSHSEKSIAKIEIHSIYSGNQGELIHESVLDSSAYESTDITMDSSMDIKDASLLDPDSTTDIRTQSLDDSLNDFSLSLPDDLELESAPSDEERCEESDEILPDSTGNGQTDDSITSRVVNDITHKEPEEPSQVSHDLPEDLPSDINKDENSSDINKKEDVAGQSCNLNNDDQYPNTTEEVRQELNVAESIGVNIPNGLPSAQEILTPIHSEKDKRELEKRAVNDSVAKSEELTIEQRQMKESVLQALGLKSLSNQQPEEKPKRDGYTGTLKAVIKLNRSGDKKRMVYQRSEDRLGELEYRICSEIPSTDGVPITHLNDISGIRKNVAKLHQESDQNQGTATTNGVSEDHDSIIHDDSKGLSVPKESNLIIPEKSSSFSIHPGRLCSDVCSYCFGKFGCLDTPCHVAQLKPERQKKILENEPHLTGESCLCDACYRYVDRKANCPSKAHSGNGNKTRVKPPASSQCCVNLCTEGATHTVKKKWLIKLKKSITNKLDIDLDKPGSMYFPLCAQHHYWVDYFTVCGICRKRLNRNHLYSLGSETDRLNLMLAEDGIPARLSDKLFLCKLCRYYSNLRLKYADPGSIPSSGQIFYRDYRRKILMSLDVPVSDSEDEHVVKEDKKKQAGKKTMSDNSINSNGGGQSSKTEESVMSLSNLATLLGEQPEQQARIQVKFGNVNIGRLSNLNIGQSGRDRDERLPYSDVGLQANLEFQGPAVPDGSWERCVSTIQFDKRTKNLWQDLQKPYGNQSSFLRHLVMLEKYWRAGYLTLAQGSDERAAKYLNGVKNRIKAFEGSSVNPVAGPSSTPPSVPDKFPLITNTGEIEVTPIRNAPKKPPVIPMVPEKKPMTPLDRAKALVRMVPPPAQRCIMPMQRYSVPMYVPTYGYPTPQMQQHRPPPLLKIRNKTAPNHPYYHHGMPQHLPTSQPLRPILPKLPRALTVTQVSQSSSAITLNRSGITIEKQSGSSSVPPSLPVEKPSISVFREPAPGPS